MCIGEVLDGAQLLTDVGDVAAMAHRECDVAREYAIFGVEYNAMNGVLVHAVEQVGYGIKHSLVVDTRDVNRGTETVRAVKLPRCSHNALAVLGLELCGIGTGTMVKLHLCGSFGQVT